MFRRRNTGPEVFLIHMGGPIWARRDLAGWSIPKGAINRMEDPLAAARRELREETGATPDGHFLPLGTFRQNSGKNLTVWAVEAAFDPAKLVSASFKMVWPPKSGEVREFPEADRGDWFGKSAALKKIVRGQRPVLEHFFATLG